MNTSQFEELADYRRAVADMYGRLRRSKLKQSDRWQQFCRERDRLFKNHPQSALSAEQKSNFTGLRYYPYNPAWRFLLPVDTQVKPEVIEVELSADGKTRLQRFGKIHFEAAGQTVSLALFWIMGYGGGIFLPFRDLTNRETTYGGGRYLLDTIKHADLGRSGPHLVVDFNYAYNPSCAYNAHWHCPLAPPENRLPIPIPAGEQKYSEEL
mgnify:CR=1 FL=1